MEANFQTKETKGYRNLSNNALEQKLLQSVSHENKLKIEILHLLAEVERRRLYSKSYPSLFEYCTKVLKYSASSAQRRIDTMRAMRLIPEIEEKIIKGELNLSSVAQAQSFFRHEAKMGKSYSIESKKEVLRKLENKTTKECVEELVSISPQSIPQEKRRELTKDVTELKVMLNKDLISRLDKIKALLSHQNPTMTDQELIEFMAKVTLNKIDPKEKAKRARKRARKEVETPPVSRTTSLTNDAAVLPMIGSETCVKEKRMSVYRYIPSTVKCEVYMRDKGQCTHPNCGSRRFLEYDHILPVAMGGKSTVDNVRLLCRNHNQYAAIERFGVRKMRRYLR